jgi:ribosomal protein L37AE/L43A
MTRLNEKGQCPFCGRKPLVYKARRIKFCARCDREFDIESGEQKENWAWRQTAPGIFEEHSIFEGRNFKSEKVGED